MMKSMSPAQPRPTGQTGFEKKKILQDMLVYEVILDV